MLRLVSAITAVIWSLNLLAAQNEEKGRSQRRKAYGNRQGPGLGRIRGQGARNAGRGQNGCLPG
jgi:hypothetical protein